MDFSIREATIEDLDDIVRMWKELSVDQLRKDNYYTGSIEFDSGEEQIKNSILSRDCGMFIMELDNAIHGFVEAWINRPDFGLKNDDCGYVVHFYIGAEVRKAKNIYIMIIKLYEEAEKWVRHKGKAYVIADAFEHNQRIITMLKKEKVLIYKTRMVRRI